VLYDSRRVDSVWVGLGNQVVWYQVENCRIRSRGWNVMCLVECLVFVNRSSFGCRLGRVQIKDCRQSAVFRWNEYGIDPRQHRRFGRDYEADYTKTIPLPCFLHSSPRRE